MLVWLRKHGKLDWKNPYEKTMSKSKETHTQKLKRLERELDDERILNIRMNSMSRTRGPRCQLDGKRWSDNVQDLVTPPLWGANGSGPH